MSGRSGGAGSLPGVMGALAAVAVGLLTVPLAGLLLRAPWGMLGGLVGTPAVRAALRLSLLCSLSALGVATVLGVPLAWVLARLDFPGKRLLRAVCVLPMVLPPVVGGVALLFVFGRQGLLGAPLAQVTGGALPFTTAGVVVAEAFVAMPFLIVTLEAGLRAVDRGYEAVAATLGAGRWTVLRRVTLPLAGPSLAAGMALCWARALGEFGATITFAGNLPGSTQTMPLAVYTALQGPRPEAALVLSLLLLAVSVTVLVALRGRFLGAP